MLYSETVNTSALHVIDYETGNRSNYISFPGISTSILTTKDDNCYTCTCYPDCPINNVKGSVTCYGINIISGNIKTIFNDDTYASVIGIDSNNLYIGDFKNIYSVDTLSSKLNWSLLTDVGINLFAISVDNSIVLANKTHLLSIDSNSNLLWSIPVSGLYQVEINPSGSIFGCNFQGCLLYK